MAPDQAGVVGPCLAKARAAAEALWALPASDQAFLLHGQGSAGGGGGGAGGTAWLAQTLAAVVSGPFGEAEGRASFLARLPPADQVESFTPFDCHMPHRLSCHPPYQCTHHLQFSCGTHHRFFCAVVSNHSPSPPHPSPLSPARDWQADLLESLSSTKDRAALLDAMGPIERSGEPSAHTAAASRLAA